MLCNNDFKPAQLSSIPIYFACYVLFFKKIEFINILNE